MSAVVHCATSLISRHPKISEFSTPMVTASLPWAAIARTSEGVVAKRNHPRPGPPLRASM